MQLVLDIDLDFFLDRIFYAPDEPQGRLSGEEYQVDDEQKVVSYLEKQCGLSESSPVPGAMCEHHVEVYDWWEAMVDEGILEPPFEVVHVDAHADLGLGNLSCLYIAEEMLSQPVEERDVPGGTDPWSLNNCNFMIYAAAMRWLGKMTYVRHPKCVDDLQWMHMKDFSNDSGALQLKQFDPGFTEGLEDFNEVKKLPFRAEPEIPLAVQERYAFELKQRPDFLFITKSPNYTPVEMDPIFEKVRPLVDPLDQ